MVSGVLDGLLNPSAAVDGVVISRRIQTRPAVGNSIVRPFIPQICLDQWRARCSAYHYFRGKIARDLLALRHQWPQNRNIDGARVKERPSGHPPVRIDASSVT